MSRIGSYNLELQEQANELGFSTTQEALEAGCVVEGDCDQPKLVDPLTAAHNALQKQRDELVQDLIAQRDDAADLALGLNEYTDKFAEIANVLERAIKLIETEVK